LRIAWLSLCVCAGAFLRPAHALEGDRYQFFAGVSYTYEDNIFKVPRGGVRPRTSDTLRQLIGGVGLQLPVSRQRFNASIRFYRANYNHLTDLDYTGRSAEANWQWQWGNDLSGRLGFTESQTSAGFSNFSERVQNLVLQRNVFFEANYQLDARWRMESGLGRLKVTNSLESREQNDYSDTNLFAGFAYITPAQNSTGLRFSYSDTSFPNPQRLGFFSINNDYKDYRLDSRYDWHLNGVSRVNGRLGYETRHHKEFEGRDFSGVTGNLTYDWTPTGKAAVAFVARREIGGLNDLTSNYVLNQGITIKPRWIFSPKLDLLATFDYSKLDYRGDPGILLGVEPSTRKDSLRSASIELNYKATYNTLFNLSLRREDRNSNLPDVDYVDNVLSGTLSVEF
jgi:exopolysaccharide biosynthesis operon protein EpsL